MLNLKTNVCKLRNGVILSLFACFQDGRQIIQNLTFSLIQSLMYLGIFVGALCWSLFYNASLCVLSIFVNTLTRKRMIVALFKLSSRCLVTVSVLLLFLTMPWVYLL